jgi:hypothetical protein
MVGRIMLVRWDECQILLACVHRARVWRAACPPPTMSTAASDSAQAKNRQYAQLSRNLAQLSATMEQTAGLMACVRDDLRAMAVVATNTATQCVLLPLARGCRLGDGVEGSWRLRRSCRRIWRRRRRRRRRSERGAFARVSFSPASPLISICAGENERVDMHMLSAPSTPCTILLLEWISSNCGNISGRASFPPWSRKGGLEQPQWIALCLVAMLMHMIRPRGPRASDVGTYSRRRHCQCRGVLRFRSLIHKTLENPDEKAAAKR